MNNEGAKTGQLMALAGPAALGKNEIDNSIFFIRPFFSELHSKARGPFFPRKKKNRATDDPSHDLTRGAAGQRQLDKNPL